MNKWESLVAPKATLRDTLVAIDRAGLGIAFICDAKKRLLGVVTDGDARRAVLKGVRLDEPIERVMNPRPISVTTETDMQEIRQLMLRHSVKQIPVLDGKGTLVDIIAMESMLRVPLSSPDLSTREVQAVLDVLATPNLSLGPRLAEFETKFAAFIGAKHAIAVNSGTSGLHLCVKALGLGPGDEVITTPFSFIASANAALFEGAKPIFVDIDPDTLAIDPAKIEAAITSRTKAILPVHIFGHPCDMDSIRVIADRHGLKVIEDACEAIGATYKGRRVGVFGDCSVFSFYPNKQMTTGEGGIIITDDDEIAKLCRSYRNQGRGEGGGWLLHERLGYNFRLTELQCALGIVQLERLLEILAKRQNLADTYSKRLKKIPGLRLPKVDPSVTMSWFVYVVQIEPSVGARVERDQILQDLRAAGIDCNNYFPPIHLQPFYRRSFGHKEGEFPITEEISQRTIALPFYTNLSTESVDRACAALAAALEKRRPARATVRSRSG